MSNDIDPVPKLPAGAYIPILLLLFVVGLGSWLARSYPGNPSQRPIADNCESVAQSNNGSQSNDQSTNQIPPIIQKREAYPPEPPSKQEGADVQIQRQIAKYNCQIAIYTDKVANFTRYLVIATVMLGAIGVAQGVILHRSVRVAARAADEARDAIRAAQTSADAANTHARAAEEANRINREILISSQRPWIDVDAGLSSGLRYDEHGAHLSVVFKLRNIGRTPAVFVNPWARPIAKVQDPAAAQQRFLSELGAQRQFGHTIFPDKEVYQPVGLTITNYEIEECRDAAIDRALMLVFIVGFVEYKSTFENTSHRTGFIYHLSKRGPNNMKLAIFRDEGDVSQEDLIFEPWWVQGGGFFAT